MMKNNVVSNTRWIVVCKIIQSVLQLIVGALCARYLGPHDYGLVGYASSLVAFAVPLVQLGLYATIVKELVDAPEKEGAIMGASIVMEVLSAIVCIAVLNVFSFMANANDPLTITVCALSSTSLLFKSFELMQRWFQYKLQSKYPSVIAVCVYVIVSAYRIYLLIAEKSVHWFALVNTLEYFLMCAALIFVYYRLGAGRMSFSLAMARQLIHKSKYYILSAVMVNMFQNTDHIMLKMMMGDTENGYYTAAVTASCVVAFLYSAIVDSMRPVIFEYKKKLDARYEKNISVLYCIIFYLTIAQGIGFTLFSKLIIKILYGSEYFKAVPVLRIIIWQISFSYMGTIRNIWILAEGKQRLVWKLNLCGVMVNIMINVLLIPKYGARGAAFASFATQMFTNFVLGFIIKELRKNNRLLLTGIHPKTLIGLIGEFRKSRG